MFVLRILSFFVLIAISIVGFVAALAQPILAIIPLVCVPLALYFVGYITRYSPTHAKVRDYKEEVELRKSPSYKYRRIFVGVVAIVLGGSLLYFLASHGQLIEEPLATIGGLAFLAMGLVSISAKNGIDVPVASAEVKDALIREALSGDDSAKRLEATQLLGRASGLSEALIDRAIAEGHARATVDVERAIQDVLDRMGLTDEKRREMEAELRKVGDGVKRPGS